VVALVNHEVADIQSLSDRRGVNPELVTDEVDDADLRYALWLPTTHEAAA
jgi:hypothetical protein